MHYMVICVSCMRLACTSLGFSLAQTLQLLVITTPLRWKCVSSTHSQFHDTNHLSKFLLEIKAQLSCECLGRAVPITETLQSHTVKSSEFYA